MAGASDPFEVVQEEARHSLLEVSAQLRRWHELRSSGSSSDAAEASRLRASISRSLAELRLDLSDLHSTVDIAARDPAKYGLKPHEVASRRKFVAEAQAEAQRAQAELEGEGSGAKGEAKGAAKGERQGLLGASCSSSSSPAEPAEPMGKSWAVRKENHAMVAAQQQQQQEQLELQDVELAGLGETVDRLGQMGRSMNEELKAQGRAFDEFTQEVESTRERMRSAVGVMNKMMKNKDRGKFCVIIFLTVVLFILMYAVFS
ncbi:hypothetical protein AB1Y20_023741 [Prymnesium parvum]|uniref:t-SNARE coiled-coil homology domain-containing protein n=1 Tax=Prymnesium parvum TaxID=97485 RepID=A0AB34JH47_PRYPA|mmetsp:Transcript_525/g.1178  ORF Transcript_525/g.1178 Transcript_525/m.1178 type:complete len:260 (+) Transcript_525:3-782(+)